MNLKRTLIVLVVAALVVVGTQGAFAAKQEVIDAGVVDTVAAFQDEFEDGKSALETSPGALVCPRIGKIGLGIGVSGGGCALLANDGTTAGYYKSTGVSIGLQAGVESHSLVMLFRTDEAFTNFRDNKRKWEASADAGVAVASKTASGALGTNNLNKAVVAVPFAGKGLIADLSIEGSRFKRINPEKTHVGLLHTFQATAEIGGDKNATSRMTIAIDRWNTESERQRVVGTLRNDGTADALTYMETIEPAGSIRQVGGKDITILTAMSREQSDGSWRVTLTTREPLGFAVPRQQAKKVENNVSVMQLNLNNKRVGTGTLVMGAEFGFDSDDRIVMAKPSISPIKLSSVSVRED